VRRFPIAIETLALDVRVWVFPGYERVFVESVPAGIPQAIWPPRKRRRWLVRAAVCPFYSGVVSRLVLYRATVTPAGEPFIVALVDPHT